MSETTLPERPEALVNNAAAKQYWEEVSADNNGMLGGFPFVSRADLRVSRSFLAKLGIGSKSGMRRVRLALEGGAGIGRVTEGLLLDMAEEVDIIEPVAKFTAQLKERLGVRWVFNVGLEDWDPTKTGDTASESSNSSSSGKEGTEDDKDGNKHLPTYGLIWIQWCTSYLNDKQLVEFLQRCGSVLEPTTGVLVIKENIMSTGFDDFDVLDSGVTRADKSFQSLFSEAGLRVVRSEVQNFPEEAGLLPVKLYALKPR
ncbi:duf858 domain containing protein [Grosmannia clavigera kw1407]|uniref:Alpha N-terminal protein methyltransferase 1 n=1 Tax=Grosmannia clavigera (strain kw1407 / UAMH 11150) TaxID=655863 RepID=F0XBS3_GROCL|nr:duf858 domain containing protein [Grosmannia clavigera kw1407]EFX05027.1 duf858 domain containing protein [Grosmannia clavigera kw1407]